ncbi:MAG: multicopper oxidase domain-containing protein, partial [Mycobacterium sp.]
MHTFMRIRRTWGAALLGVLALLFVFGSGAAQAVTFDLTAKAGSTLLPGAPGPVSVWGYVDTLTNPPVTQPGGPVLIVNEGDSVTVNLTNTLTVATGMLFQGQAMVPDTTGAPAGGGTKTYTFTATNPGTFLYEAGLLPNAQHQAAMGLYGALVVRPAVAGQAYADAGTAFNDEAVLVVSEIDPGLNNSATPAAFDMRNYAPRHFLINGKAYPDTDAITGNAGNKLLLRYVNAGIQHHSMGVLGLRQIFVAKDGSVLPMLNHNVVAETLAPG